MRFIHIIKNRMNFIFVTLSFLILFGCQSISKSATVDPNSNMGPLVITKSKTTNEEIENLKRNINNQSIQLNKIEEKISLQENKINDYFKSIDTSFIRKNEILQLQSELTTILDGKKLDFNEYEFIEILNKLKKKIDILEDRTFYTDSLYFEIVTDVVLLENKISSLLLSFKEMNDLSESHASTIIPKITDEEFTAQYIESLSQYQNSEWDLSLNGFNYLIQANRNHDLSDNCQYWIGEVYYALNDYNRSIREFKKVFGFSGTNKADDAKFKIGVCYMNIGELDQSIKEFTELIETYPNSEYYNRAQNYLKQY